MNSEIDAIFSAYENLCAGADKLFNQVAQGYPGCVTCKKGCSDCCHALFDLSLVEAMYINRAFAKKYGYGRERSDILEQASRTDRSLTRVKRDLFRAEKAGARPEKIMEKAASIRAQCPLLAENMVCRLYNSRPITCRLYGIPVEIAGEGHVCGLADFDRGKAYPTVKLQKIQDRLEELSGRLAAACGSEFEFGDVYVPISMALLTNYDDKYFGKKKDD